MAGDSIQALVLRPAAEPKSIEDPIGSPPQYGEESDDERNVEPPNAAKALRLKQHDLFKAYVLENATKMQVEHGISRQLDPLTSGDDRSAAAMLLDEGPGILDNPREYQVELFERAKQQNTIAVLDTGSGKTLIAVLLIRHILDTEVEDRAKGANPCTTFFMVPSNTLVYQQTAVLSKNLDGYKIASRCGDMNCHDAFEKAAWSRRLAENMVVVCTPEILHSCLVHSFVRMDQINLLVFDEAHHAKKNNPYAKIVRDYYVTRPDEPTMRRPRIFGMTASPVDAKTDIVRAATSLERLLECRIATYPLSEEYRNKAQEVTLLFNMLERPFKTPLYERLFKEFGHMRAFNRLFMTAEYLSSELGHWASEKYWEFALAEEGLNKAHGRIVKLHDGKDAVAVSTTEEELNQLSRAYRIVKEHDFGEPSQDLCDISSKVEVLYSFLKDMYSDDLGMRAIVFVERKATARMLNEIFNYLRPDFLKPALLIGHAAGTGDMRITFREQVVTMTRFHRGDVNCLFATSVAEEGLDIPDCNLVIRFDLYKTMIEYIQSKGRTRHQNSKFIDMIERGRAEPVEHAREIRFQARQLRDWVNGLDPSRKLLGLDHDLNKHDAGGRAYQHPETGAKLNYSSALTILSHFSATLTSEDKTVASEPYYIVDVVDGQYVGEVIMPAHSPIGSHFGLRYTKKSTARRSAAFSMCLSLLEGGYLDSSLLSTYKKLKPLNANAHLAVSSKKKGTYAMRAKPSMWEDGRGTMPQQLFLTIIDFPDGLDRPHQPIALMTRHPLPQFPEFSLFLDSGKITRVHTVPFAQVDVNERDVIAFTSYTLLLWNHVNAKIFENNPAQMSYWVVPIIQEYKLAISPHDCLDWPAIQRAAAEPFYQWAQSSSPSSLIDKFIVDPWAGNRRFFSVRIDPDLQAESDVPANTAKFDRPGASKKKNILQYSVSLYGKKFQEKWESWDRTQPVVECIQVLHRQNLLAPPAPKEKRRTDLAYLCLEPMHISMLDSNVVATFLAFPPIIHRVEDYLIALEVCDLVGISLSPGLALEAVTKDSDNSEDHYTDDRINFRPGMGNNYERLEFLGDCFLKMATSMSLYVLKPHNNEFEFHVARMLMICNQNLCNNALELDLTAYARTMAFSRRTWYPEGLTLLEGRGKGKSGTEVIKHSLGDKTVADICEAFIGAAFFEHHDPKKWSPESWTDAIRAVSRFAKNENHEMQDWSQYAETYVPPAWQTERPLVSDCEFADRIGQKLGHHFRWPQLIRCAVRHPSYPYAWGNIPSYQRLEFLGDALLDLACITHLFYNYRDEGPQWLTEHKMAMVSNKFLGAVCVKLELHVHLRHNHPTLGSAIQRYVDEVELAAQTAKGEVDYWTQVKDPPKCLPDIVESCIGAIFIDSGFRYDLVQEFFEKNIKPFFMDMSFYDTFASNHPTTLLHRTLSQVYECRAYQLLCERVDADTVTGKPKMMAGLIVHDKVIASVVGESGRYAKEKACKLANHELHGLTVIDFKNKFGCDCISECEDLTLK